MWTINDFKPIYQEFLESGKTVKQFCADIEFAESRFFRWQKKLRMEAASSPNGEFVPVSVNNHGDKVVLVDKSHPFQHRGGIQQPTCEICFPNGVTVRLSGSIQLGR